MSRKSVNNPQLATNFGGEWVASLSFSNQKRNLGGFNWIIFTSVINNYIYMGFSSSLNKVKVKINGF